MTRDVWHRRPIMKRVLLSWSSGKDSAWSLHVLRQDAGRRGRRTVDDLQRVGRPRRHARGAARARGGPSAGRRLAPVARAAALAVLKRRLRGADAAKRSSEHGGRASRISRLATCSWKTSAPTASRSWRGRESIRFFPSGPPSAKRPGSHGKCWPPVLRAVLTCVDPKQLDARFVGRRFDADLLAELPAGVDPCGERGEFHTFCCAGPMFARPDFGLGRGIESARRLLVRRRDARVRNRRGDC